MKTSGTLFDSHLAYMSALLDGWLPFHVILLVVIAFDFCLNFVRPNLCVIIT